MVENPDNAAIPPPWRACVVKVEDDRPRVRIPKELAAVVSWLRSSTENIPGLASVGVRAGITICPLLLLEKRAKIRSAISDESITRSGAGTDTLDYARYDAGSWPVTIQKESTRHTVYLPEEARKLGLVPEAGQLAVVFGAGEILEIWGATDWVENLRIVAANLGRLEKVIPQRLKDKSREE